MQQATTRASISTDDPMRQTAADLIALIQEIGAELRIRPAQLKSLNLDTSFDKELGLDSLTRMEFLTRIEKRFGVSLPEQVFGSVETPRELLREILGARSRSEPATAAAVSELVLEQTQDSPDSAQTLVDVIYWHARTHPDRPHIKLYEDEEEGEIITYQDLVNGAERVAAGLQEAGLKPRQAVSIMLPTGKDYFFTFFGILIAGGTPVPIYPPARLNQLEDHLLRHSKILSNCQAVILVTVPEAKSVARLLKAQAEALETVITPTELAASQTSLLRPQLSPEDIAFLQYTSGSTGVPKGVVLTHRNLLANIRAMGEKAQVTSSDVFVSWLPLYHDMGLIGAWLGNLYFAAFLVIMSPLSFLARPSRWLWAIHRNRATMTAAPNFAYELCLKRVDEATAQGLKLDSIRAVFNGAEPISPATLERFIERFSQYGFQAGAMMPVYGLAECSLGLSFPPLGRGPKIDAIDRKTFMETGHARPAQNPEGALRFVACGEPLPGHEIRILDAAGRELPERQQGRLEFRGPSTTSGYFRNAEASASLFHDDWLNSGDMAYIADGEVYLTGRSKDIIIHAGRNIYPHELEEAVSGVEGIRKGCVAVFGSADPATGTERLVILAETRETEEDRQEQLRSAINGVIAELAGTAPDDVVLAPPHSVLKTSSGKIRRAGCKELYERGLIGKGTRPVWHQITRMLIAASLPQLRRHLQSGLAILYGVYAWLLFLPFVLLTWAAVVSVPRPAWRWPIMRKAGRLLTTLLGTPVVLEGENHLPAGEPCILVCNHSSYLDGFILARTLPLEFSFVAKAELATQFFAGKFLRAINTEFVSRFDKDQGVSDAKRVIHAASQARSVLFFPEGTISRMPGLLPFHMGAFVAAAETGLPVVPIALRGTRAMLRAGSWLPRRSVLTLRIGTVIKPAAGDGDAWEKALRLRDAAREQMLQLAGEPDLSHEKSPLLTRNKHSG